MLFLALLLAACQADTANAPASTGSDSPAASQASRPAAIGDSLQLELFLLDGNHFKSQELRGKWLVINYWATWCSPCLKEMPELSALHARRADVEVLGLAYEDSSASQIRDFLQRHPVSYPIGIVAIDQPPAALGAPTALPLTWLVSPEGRLVQKFTGPVSAAQLENRMALPMSTPHPQ